MGHYMWRRYLMIEMNENYQGKLVFVIV